MDSLRRIESLPESRRSSFIGQAGVLSDLKELPRNEAFSWLEKHLASPISRDWGGLLFSLRADWMVIDRWIHLSKGHCLAACDALSEYSSSSLDAEPVLPKGSTPQLVLEAVQTANAKFGNPRIQAVLDTVKSIWQVREIPKAIAQDINALADVAAILLGNQKKLLDLWSRKQPIVATPEKAIWHDLIHYCDDKHAVVVADWRADVPDVHARIWALPVLSGVAHSDSVASPNDSLDMSIAKLASFLFPHGYSIRSIETGSDEWVLIVLPRDEMSILESSPLCNFFKINSPK